MICPECSQERKDADFFGKDKCYKCIYKEKTSVSSVVKKCICKICSSKLPMGKRKFCSQNCADEAMKIHNKTYWTRNINVQNIEWN